LTRQSVSANAGTLFKNELIPDSNFYIPDLGSEFFHPGSGSAFKNLSILTPKLFISFKKYDPGCSSRIPDMDPEFFSGSGSQKIKQKQGIPDLQH
jgi:hypothetical protein